jgi:hypothetical protein
MLHVVVPLRFVLQQATAPGRPQLDLLTQLDTLDRQARDSAPLATSSAETVRAQRRYAERVPACVGQPHLLWISARAAATAAASPLKSPQRADASLDASTSAITATQDKTRIRVNPIGGRPSISTPVP